MAVGRKTGGRRKGTPNRATAAVAAAVAASGSTPLEYLLSVMRNEFLDVQVRLAAATAAAPYCHPRLSAVAVRAVMEQPEDARRREELLSSILSVVDQNARGRNGSGIRAELFVGEPIELAVS